jgi:hypothetical protein
MRFGLVSKNVGLMHGLYWRNGLKPPFAHYSDETDEFTESDSLRIKG